MAKFSVRISNEAESALEILAKETERSKGFILRKALDFYLASQEVQKYKIQS
jgi:predicted transcriptional regulator